MSDTWYRSTVDPAVADTVATLLGQIPTPEPDPWPVGPFSALLRPIRWWTMSLSTERVTSRFPATRGEVDDLLDAILPDRLLPTH